KMQAATPALEKALANLVEFADKHPKEASALTALTQVVSNSFAPSGPKSARSRAVEVLLRDHVGSDKLGPVCQQLAGGFGGKNVELLRAVLEKNPHKAVQAEACLALAQYLQQQAQIARRVATDADLAKRFETFYGKEATEALKKADLAKLEDDGEAAF